MEELMRFPESRKRECSLDISMFKFLKFCDFLWKVSFSQSSLELSRAIKHESELWFSESTNREMHLNYI